MIENNKPGIKTSKFFEDQIDKEYDFEQYLLDFKKYKKQSDSKKLANYEARKEAEQKRDEALPSILITSGFSFEGYKITKYSGYISGDDVIEIARGTDSVFSGATSVGDSLTKSLVQIRRNALRELKEAAYDLGCNAVIGVDFDYITLDPETANGLGGTTYFTICVLCYS